ncbi:MAG: MBL fold metallo-hydrolase [Nevskiaceae bacterium]|nr:MAG: MBL fold metallo-hydrolase [Nevskiaceae bacterium]TBR74610.1 MAG: MBL fold metallo-hydrolase [Nevskiaceae bacterium]
MDSTNAACWKIGEAVVTRIREQALEGILDQIIPPATPAALRAIDWLMPNFVTPDGVMRWNIQAFVIEADGRRILVDTCIGNDKSHPQLPFWDQMHTRFLDDLEGAGFARESIDTVLCTHLHLDHVGWNTMKVGGRWVPTFPGARYLVSRTEFDYWQEEEAHLAGLPDGDGHAFQKGVLGESILPIVEAGLFDFVATDHRLCDEVRLIPTPGHTPGHVSVEITSAGQRAVITGDLVHHPCQIRHPEWATTADFDGACSTRERKRFFADVSARPTLVIGTHWAEPTVGRIVRDGAAWRLDC